MILVRDVLQVKFGQMDKMLAAIRAAAAGMEPGSVSISRILTDVSGPFFTLVIEAKAESIDAYRERMTASLADLESRRFRDSTMGLVESGRREFYNIEWEA